MKLFKLGYGMPFLLFEFNLIIGKPDRLLELMVLAKPIASKRRYISAFPNAPKGPTSPSRVVADSSLCVLNQSPSSLYCTHPLPPLFQDTLPSLNPRGLGRTHVYP